MSTYSIIEGSLASWNDLIGRWRYLGNEMTFGTIYS